MNILIFKLYVLTQFFIIKYIKKDMQQRTQFNIGESEKTSVKVHHNPGGNSNFSLGWGEDDKPKHSSIFILMKFTSTTMKVKLFWVVKMKEMMRRIK